MFRRQPRGIFADPQVKLTMTEATRARDTAQSAARESQRSLRTARGQYRRYRATAGEKYLDWPTWHAIYLITYGKKVPFGSARDIGGSGVGVADHGKSDGSISGWGDI